VNLFELVDRNISSINTSYVTVNYENNKYIFSPLYLSKSGIVVRTKKVPRKIDVWDKIKKLNYPKHFEFYLLNKSFKSRHVFYNTDFIKSISYNENLKYSSINAILFDGKSGKNSIKDRVNFSSHNFDHLYYDRIHKIDVDIIKKLCKSKIKYNISKKNLNKKAQIYIYKKIISSISRVDEALIDKKQLLFNDINRAYVLSSGFITGLLNNKNFNKKYKRDISEKINKMYEKLESPNLLHQINCRNLMSICARQSIHYDYNLIYNDKVMYYDVKHKLIKEKRFKQ
jgi:hypothetical protein